MKKDVQMISEIREAIERYNDAEGSISAYDTLDEIVSIIESEESNLVIENVTKLTRKGLRR